METQRATVTIVSLSGDDAVGSLVADFVAGAGGGRVGPAAAVLVAGPVAASVGEAVAALREAGVAAAGWVGDPSDPAVRDMAAELFPGHEVVAR